MHTAVEIPMENQHSMPSSMLSQHARAGLGVRHIIARLERVLRLADFSPMNRAGEEIIESCQGIRNCNERMNEQPHGGD